MAGGKISLPPLAHLETRELGYREFTDKRLGAQKLWTSLHEGHKKIHYLHLMIPIHLLLRLLLTMSTNQPFEEQNTLIYIGDPMCSWCYGFAPEITKIKAGLPKDVGFQIVVGGLRPHGTETMAELADFLKEHWVEIHERTGQPFAYDLLQQADFIYDTEPACRAVVTARKMDESKALDFFKAIQHSFYAENNNTSFTKTYTDIATALGMDAGVFESLFLSDEIKAATATDFEVARQMGIHSFPSLVLKKGKEYFLVGRGYAEAEGILERLNQIIRE
jgi:putative protein-disulfide isomerase